MEIKYLLCAQSAVVDQATRNVSIHNVIERLSFPVFPAALPVTVVAHFTRKRREMEKPTLDLVITMDDGKTELARQTFAISFQGQLGTRLIGNIQPLVVEAPGNVSVQIDYKKKKLGSWEIIVRKIDETPLLQSVPIGVSTQKRRGKKRGRRKKRL